MRTVNRCVQSGSFGRNSLNNVLRSIGGRQACDDMVYCVEVCSIVALMWQLSLRLTHTFLNGEIN